MTDQFHVDDMATLQNWHTYMAEITAEYQAVMTYVSTEVCSKAGFVGLLEPLQQVMDWISTGAQTVTDGTTTRWEELRQSVWDAAATYDRQDGQVSSYFRTAAAASGGGGGPMRAI